MSDQSSQTQKYLDALLNQDTPIGQRYQAIFYLKNINTPQSITALINAYPSVAQSVLLAHQILYALGQVNEEHFPLVKDFLLQRVQDQNENGIARHEAAEALANYFHLIEGGFQNFFEKYAASKCPELSDTCKISLQKAKNKQLAALYGTKFFATKQPAAPFTKEEFDQFLQTKNLRDTFSQEGFLGLMLKPQTEISLFEKYRIMYHMRDLGTEQAIHTLCQILSKKYSPTQSPLLKHEVCFILGQIGCGQYENLVRECIQNDEQAQIVRHEALAAVASQSKDVQYLEKFMGHENRLIKESAQVAEFTIKYWSE